MKEEKKRNRKMGLHVELEAAGRIPAGAPATGGGGTGGGKGKKIGG